MASSLRALAKTYDGKAYYSGAAQDVHPTYARLWRAWRMAELAYAGGEDYRYPDLTWDWARPTYRKSETGDQALEPEARSLYSFLRPFDREPDWQYEHRLLMASPPRDITEAVDKIAAFTLAQQIDRNAAGVPGLDLMWGEGGDSGGDADMRGTSWHEMMGRMVRGALVYGPMHAIVDMPSVEQRGILRRLLRLGPKPRPYLTPKTPLEIPKWTHDAEGALVRLEVLEPDTRDDPQDPWRLNPRAPLSRIWTPETWQLFDSQGHEVTPETPHAFGCVPLVTMYCRRSLDGDPMRGTTPTLTAIYDAQDLFNLNSEVQQALRALYSFPVITGRTNLSKADIGTADALVLPEGSDIQFRNASSEPIKVLVERIAEKREGIRAAYGLSRGLSEQSISERSGDALLVETSERSSIVKALADQARAFELAVAAMVARVQGRESEATVHYPDTYDVETPGEKIAVAKDLLALPGLEKPAADAIRDDVVRTRLRSIYSAEELAGIMAAIESGRTEAEDAEDETAMVGAGAGEGVAPPAGATAAAIEAARPEPIYDWHAARGIATPNEIRARIGLPPREGGDKTLPEAVREGEPGTMDGEELARRRAVEGTAAPGPE